MGTYTRRIQAVLSDEQHATLSQLAHDLGKPLSVLVREAVEQVYFAHAQRQKRQAALESLLSLGAPVAEWKEMEAEIIRGAGGGIPPA